VSEETEEVLWRLRYGNAIDGLAHLLDVYYTVHGKRPEKLEVIPAVYRMYLQELATEQRYSVFGVDNRNIILLFCNVPVFKGIQCRAHPE